MRSAAEAGWAAEGPLRTARRAASAAVVLTPAPAPTPAIAVELAATSTGLADGEFGGLALG